MLAFVLPVITACFWLTGPHEVRASCLWLLPLVVLYGFDRIAPAERRQPREDIPSWPYTLQLYALFAIQLANHALLIVTAAQLRFDTAAHAAQTLAMFLATVILAGTNAAYSGIAVAHELIHRRHIVEYTMGRMLLGCVLYEHYATEHIRGHHPQVGTAQDAVTARFGESNWVFVRRTVPAQLASAWALERARLNHAVRPLSGVGWLRHRVLQGWLAQVVVLVSVTYFFGLIALVFFVTQALISVVILETVNYVEHWGLTRAGKRVLPEDSWDTDNAFTLYTLVGLSRHSDHHAQASRSYQKLRHYPETAKLPAGYYSTLLKALFRNAQYRKLATAELRRTRLGPFRDHSALRDASVTNPLVIETTSALA
jgi:alkane 1-monooxygenase